MSRTISFSINGGIGHDKSGRTWHDPDGNPVPKLKMTGRQHWTPSARRYVAWKAWVVRSLEDGTTDADLLALFRREQARCLKPIPKTREKMRMTVVAHYKNHKHPDTENVFGSIADALFQNDSSLAGSFDFEVGDKKWTGKTIVTIELPDSIL